MTTLREWMQADRSFHRWQEQMRLQVREWQENEEDAGVLLRKAPLVEAQGWTAQRREQSEARPQKFTTASANDQEQLRLQVTPG